MKEELKKSLRTYGALLLLGVTGVPLGAAVGLIEGQIPGGGDIGLQALLLVADGPHLSEVIAGPDAASALDAAVVLPDDDGRAGADFQGLLFGELVLHAGMENA